MTNLLWACVRNVPGVLARGLGAAARNWPSTVCILFGCSIVVLLAALLLAHFSAVKPATEPTGLATLGPDSWAAWLAHALGGPESPLATLVLSLVPGGVALSSMFLVTSMAGAQAEFLALTQAEDPDERRTARREMRHCSIKSLLWALGLVGLLPLEAELRRVASAAVVTKIDSYWLLELVLASPLNMVIAAVGVFPGGFALAYLVGYLALPSLGSLGRALWREDEPSIEDRAKERAVR